MTAICQTTDCPQAGVPKAVGVTLAEGEYVTCGACGQPCTIEELP